VVVVDVAHHVTQRGNARQAILTEDADRVAYLELLRQYSALYRLGLLGYCLMSNHVHLIFVPRTPQGLSQTLKHTHGRYASYWNARKASTGHVWQGRFYSCPLDDAHLWVALRYVELNPVRAGLVVTAEQWRWSSAAAHCRADSSDTLLEMNDGESAGGRQSGVNIFPPQKRKPRSAPCVSTPTRAGRSGHPNSLPLYNISNGVGRVKGLGLLVFVSLDTRFSTAHTHWSLSRE